MGGQHPTKKYRRTLIWLMIYLSSLVFIYYLIHSKITSITSDESSSSMVSSRGGYDRTIIIYNRIPKTGSTTLTNAIAYDLCKQNAFHTIHLNVTKNRHVMNIIDQRRFIENITEWNQRLPAFYHGHIAFLDFTRFGIANPIYINMLREPFDRLVSHYYFLRYGDNYRIGLKRSRAGNNETFDECIERHGKDCDPKQMWLQIPFFCGMDAACSEAGNAWALERAKRNLINHYLLVGITENMRDFIALLEAIMPRFFRGALVHFNSLDDRRMHMRNTKKKVTPSAATSAIVKDTIVYQMEREFYEFAKRQFDFVMERVMIERDHNGNPIFIDKEYHYEKIKPIEH